MKNSPKFTKAQLATSVAALAVVVGVAIYGMRSFLGDEAPVPVGPPSATNPQTSHGPGFQDMKMKYANKLVITYPKTPSSLSKRVDYVIPSKYSNLYFYYNQGLYNLAKKITITWTQGYGNTKKISMPLSMLRWRYCNTKMPEGGWERIDLGKAIGMPAYPGYPEDHPNFISKISVMAEWPRPGTELHGPLAQETPMFIAPTTETRLEVVELK